MYCRWCGTPLKADAHDSIHVCGSKDRPSSFCMNCGSALTPGGQFCGMCAMPAGVAPRQATTPAPIASPAIPPGVDPPRPGDRARGKLLSTGPVPDATSGWTATWVDDTPVPETVPASAVAPTFNPMAIAAFVVAFSPIYANALLVPLVLVFAGSLLYVFMPTMLMGALAATLGSIARGQIAAAARTERGAGLAAVAVLLGVAWALVGLLLTLRLAAGMLG
jgi:hypothetical protein